MNFRDLSIKTPRFLLRSLVASDPSQKYLTWMKDEIVSKYITAASETHSLASLEAYIREK